MNQTLSEKKTIAVIFSLAICLRLGYLLFLQNHYFFFSHPGDDVQYYKEWAMAIVRGEDFTQGQAYAGMPLFPYYLAVLLKLCLGHWPIVQIFNLILGAFNCVLIYFLAQKILNTRIAVIASLLAATNFILIYYDWLMMPVTILITLTLIIILALTAEGPLSKKDWTILGLLLGAACLGDGKFLIFIGLLILYLSLKTQQPWQNKILTLILPLCLGLLITLGGVTLRNKIVSGEWIFITSQSGLSLFVGNNPEATGVYDNPEFIRPTHKGQDLDQKIFVQRSLQRSVSTKEVNEYFRHKAMTFIMQQPREYLKLLIKKLRLFLSDAEQAFDVDLLLQRSYKYQFDFNPYLFIAPFAMLGLGLAWRDKREITILALVLLSQLIFCLIYFVTTRHRAPILPLLLILEAYTLNWVIEKIKTRKLISLMPALLFTIGFVLIFPPQFMAESEVGFLFNSKAGIIYDERKDYKKAEASYLNALRLRPQDSNTAYNLGTAYLNDGNYPKAKDYYELVLKISPFNVDASFNLGYIYEITGETHRAIKAYTQVLHDEPNSLDARFRLATVYQNVGLCTEAKTYYDEIIHLKPELSSELNHLLAKCQATKNP